MKILMLLSNPFVVDPRVYKEAKTLTRSGHEISVLVWDRKKEYLDEEEVEGEHLIRIHNTGLMKALPNDLFRNPLWWRKAYKKALELYKEGFGFDVVHCHDLDTLQTGVWLKKKTGCKLVYDAHEIFGYMICWDVPKFVTRFAFWLEKTLVREVDHIITVTEPVKDYFKALCKKPISLVMNCKDLIGEYRPPKNDVFTLSYMGVLHKRRFFPELVDLIGNIENMRLVLAVKKENMDLYRIVKKKCEMYKNIDFLGHIPHQNVLKKTLGANAVINILHQGDPQAQIGIQNKLFEAMVCGRPILVCGNTYTGKIVEQEKCGITVEFDKHHIKQGVITLRDNPKLCEELGRNGLRAAKEKYHWSKEKEKLLRIYEELMS